MRNGIAPVVAWTRRSLARAVRPIQRVGLQRTLIAAALITSMLPLSGCVAWQCCNDARHPGESSTTIGEQRSIALSDGSTVWLNTRSSVRVDISSEARTIYLNEGQILCEVARDTTRPFRVHVGNTVLQADGTKFDVRRIENRTSVAVVEGQVRIDVTVPDAAKPNALAVMRERVWLTAGEGVSIVDKGGVSAPASIDATEVMAWRQRRLVFTRSTLADIVEELGRYNPAMRLRVEGKLREKRYAGVLDADDPASLITYLMSEPDIIVKRDRHGVVARAHPAAAL